MVSSAMAAARKTGSLIPSWPPVFSSSLPDAQYDETLKDIRKNETEPFKGHNLLHKFMSNLIQIFTILTMRYFVNYWKGEL